MPKSKKSLLAIKLSVKLGKDMQDPKYKLASAYIRGYTHSSLAKEFAKLSKFKEYDSVRLEQAVRYALVGNHDAELGNIYEGVLNKEVHEIHAKRHKQECGRSRGRISTLEKSGVHASTSEQLRNFAVRAAIARGRTPWTESEVQDARTLSKHPFFRFPEEHRSRGMINYSAVSHALNYLYHEGKEVRYPNSTYQALKRNSTDNL